MTMHHISTVNVATNTNPVLFANIPQNFAHLQFRYNARSSFNGQSSSIYLIINNSTGAADNSHHSIAATQTGALSRWSAASSNTTLIPTCMPAATGLANTFGSGIIDIFDYTSTTKRKMFKAFFGQNQNATTPGVVGLASGQPLNIPVSTAITQIELYFDGTAAPGSTFSLYGITAASGTGT